MSNDRLKSFFFAGIPFIADQRRSISKSVILGTAVFQDIRFLTPETFKASILKAVTDSKINKRAKEVAKLFRDKPQKPLDLAVWWVEHVIRNPQLDNLKSPTLKLGFFASQSYDVLFVIIGVLHVILYILIKFVKAITNMSRKKSKTE